MLKLLEIAYDTPSGRPSGHCAIEIPPPVWIVSGKPVSTEERVQAISTAEANKYLTTVMVAGYPIPAQLTAAGRHFVEQWREVSCNSFDPPGST